MFRFTIRELLLVMCVVALCVSWWLREHHMHEELVREKVWRPRANALEYLITQEGDEVRWDSDKGTVSLVKKHESGAMAIHTVKTRRFDRAVQK